MGDGRESLDYVVLLECMEGEKETDKGMGKRPESKQQLSKKSWLAYKSHFSSSESFWKC